MIIYVYLVHFDSNSYKYIYLVYFDSNSYIATNRYIYFVHFDSYSYLTTYRYIISMINYPCRWLQKYNEQSKRPILEEPDTDIDDSTIAQSPTDNIIIFEPIIPDVLYIGASETRTWDPRHLKTSYVIVPNFKVFKVRSVQDMPVSIMKDLLKQKFQIAFVQPCLSHKNQELKDEMLHSFDGETLLLSEGLQWSSGKLWTCSFHKTGNTTRRIYLRKHKSADCKLSFREILEIKSTKYSKFNWGQTDNISYSVPHGCPHKNSDSKKRKEIDR